MLHPCGVHKLKQMNNKCIKQIFIAGPVNSKNINMQQKKFQETEQNLRKSGWYDFINPFNNPERMKENISENDSISALKHDIENLLCSFAVYFMNEWQQSEECLIEKHIADQCGIHEFFENEEDARNNPWIEFKMKKIIMKEKES